MRYLDLAMATLIGTSAITGIIAWNPSTGDAYSRQAELQINLSDGLLSLLQDRGTAWFIRSPPSAVCAYLAASTNSSYRIYATVGSLTCGSPPQEGSTVAALTLAMTPLEVTLAAWSPV